MNIVKVQSPNYNFDRRWTVAISSIRDRE